MLANLPDQSCESFVRTGQQTGADMMCTTVKTRGIGLVVGMLALAALAGCSAASQPEEGSGAEASVSAAGSAVKAAANTLTEEERAAGWRLRFDGETTSGWRGYRLETMPDGWHVVDGGLTGRAAAGRSPAGDGGRIELRAARGAGGRGAPGGRVERGAYPGAWQSRGALAERGEGGRVRAGQRGLGGAGPEQQVRHDAALRAGAA